MSSTGETATSCVTRRDELAEAEHTELVALMQELFIKQASLGEQPDASPLTRKGSTRAMGCHKRAPISPSPEAETFPSGLWTIDDVCRYLQFGRTSVFGFMKQKHHPLPVIRIGPSPRFRKTDIDRWIEQWEESVS
jgi:predicted DNA-binding transcriptional regulator AlpA